MDTAIVGEYRIVAHRLGPDDRELRIEEGMPSSDYPWKPLRTIALPDGVDVTEASDNVSAWVEALWALGYARGPSNTLLLRATDAELLQGAAYWQRASKQITERYGQLLEEAERRAKPPGRPGWAEASAMTTCGGQWAAATWGRGRSQDR